MRFALTFFDSASDIKRDGKHVTALLPANAKRFLKKRLFDLTGLCLAAITVTLFLAVTSYRPGDASLNSATGLAPSNLIGYLGAIVADLLMQTFGQAVYLFILGTAAWSWRLLKKQALSHVAWRTIALTLTVVAAGVGLSGLSTINSQLFGPQMGGALGAIVHNRVVDLFTTNGWADCEILVSAVALFLAFLLWFFALGLTWLEWRNWGSAFASSFILLGKYAKKINILFPFAPTLISRTPDSRDKKDMEARSGPYSELPTGNEINGPSPDSKLPARNDLVAPRKPKPKAGKKAKATRQGKLDLEPSGNSYIPPLLDFLEVPIIEKGSNIFNKDALEQNAKFLASVLQDFGIKGEIAKVRPGPVVTLYELEPAPGTKTSRVISLSDDIARSMSAVSVRVAVVPGRNAIGIELPNIERETVFLRELLASADFEKSKSKLPLALGKDIGGGVVVVDLARMPHLLIAGTTGSGKSVAMNTMILSLLFSLSPDECRLIMIDPKMLELSVYEGIPHLLTPVVTEPGKAIIALKWAVREMEDRYRNMSQLGVRNIGGYNARIEDAIKKGETLTRRIQTGFDEQGKPIIEDVPLPMDPLPFIVVVVDEMADLMLVAGKDVEAAIQRLAQMARAAGIHLIMATQRPSVDVITGTVKANFPTRVSFQVTSKIDSRTILGEQGAEQLLGQGDMLYMAGGGRITRVHGPFVSDDEVEHVVAHLKGQGAPIYIDEVTIDDESFISLEEKSNKANRNDELYDEAVSIVAREGKASTSFIQRHLQIGYNRAARIIEQMEKEGVISPANRVGRREVLVGSH